MVSCWCPAIHACGAQQKCENPAYFTSEDGLGGLVGGECGIGQRTRVDCTFRCGHELYCGWSSMVSLRAGVPREVDRETVISRDREAENREIYRQCGGVLRQDQPYVTNTLPLLGKPVHDEDFLEFFVSICTEASW